MISLLMPTRNRLAWLERAVLSVRATAQTEVEIVVWVDDDDLPSAEQAEKLKLKYVIRPRIRSLSKMMNGLAEIATGDILGLSNDDFIYRTVGWDKEIEAAYDGCPDKILLVHGTEDHVHAGNFAVHPFLSRRWMEITGRFCPEYFPADLIDNWLNDVANMLGRRRHLPNVYIEHMHFSLGKSVMDQTYREGRELLQGTEDYYGKYSTEDMLQERLREVDKLRKAMA